MNDEQLINKFGMTTEEVEAEIERFEGGKWAELKFGKPIEGRPSAKMKTTSLKFYDFELAAIDAAAKREGISRSAFVRRACDNELVALA